MAQRESRIAKIKGYMKRKNFASKDQGATVVDSSSGVLNSKSILSKSKDEYLILPYCNHEQNTSLVIHLSEDVAVDAIVLTN